MTIAHTLLMRIISAPVPLICSVVASFDFNPLVVCGSGERREEGIKGKNWIHIIYLHNGCTYYTVKAVNMRTERIRISRFLYFVHSHGRVMRHASRIQLSRGNKNRIRFECRIRGHCEGAACFSVSSVHACQSEKLYTLHFDRMLQFQLHAYSGNHVEI